jgi:dimethylaniline monooxygenase (N-oxide forming)
VPKYPPHLSPEDAEAKGFHGLVFHSMYFNEHIDELLNTVRPLTDPKPGHAIVVGGGKSGWE